MNPSTAQATVLVDELVRNGVRHVVVCPGSRNAPLSMALHDAAVADRLTLHVRVDERSAGFLALGLARGLAGRGHAAVVCTSGTAVANLHPALLEARHSGTPLLALTADRPAELHGTGANQTVDQHGVFGSAVSTVEFPLAEERPRSNGIWRGLVCRAVATAETGGPVQLNIPFREPLVPGFDPYGWPGGLAGRADGSPWTVRATGRAIAPETDLGHLPGRAVLVLGDTTTERARDAAEVAVARGWPVLAEPTAVRGALAGRANLLRHGSVLLAAGDLPGELRPDAVVVVGRPTLSRGVQRLVTGAPVLHVVGDGADWVDPGYAATHVSASLRGAERGAHDGDWLPGWQRVDDAVATVVDKVLGEQPWPSGLQVARELLDALPEDAVLFLGSSNPVRDVDLVAAHRDDVLVVANRGVAGIDGSVSSAIGHVLAVGDRPGFALLGDLTFLHDLNGLLIGPAEARPDLAIVVLNDDGGGIFSLLEQGAAEHAASFERVFGTPHGARLGQLCAGYGVPHTSVADAVGLRSALAGHGLRVIEIRAERAGLRDLHARLRAAVADAVLR